MDYRRLFLTLIFTISAFLLWDGWSQQKAAQKAATIQAAAQTAPTASVDLRKDSNGVPARGANAPAAEVAVANAPTVTIKTDEYVANISLAGATISNLELVKHKGWDQSGDVELFGKTHKYVAQSGLIGDDLPNHKTLWRQVSSATEMKAGQNTLDVVFEADGGKVTKTLTFKRGEYGIDVTYQLKGAADKADAYFQLVRDDKAPAGDPNMVSVFTGPAFYTDAQKFNKIKFADIADGSVKFDKTADNGWVAMIQHYFVTAFLPAAGTPREFYARQVEPGVFAAGVIVPMPAAVNGVSTLTVPLYAGPQEHSTLEKVAPGFDLVVDYGWLTVLAAPIFWVLEWLERLTGNWGWAIVVLTILLKLIFFPLSAASYKSMARMRTVTPRLMALKERYGNDKQKLNQEMMDLYRKEKINPLGGCLPILVQIPVFIALYWVLLGAVEMRNAPWVGWIHDLTQPDPFYILPAIMMATMLFQVKLNPTPPDPIQAKIMWIMPLGFGIMFFFFPAGLVLYWTVNNVLSIAQQWAINRKIEADTTHRGHR
ncbi:MAG: membrane protein insertase YidC [Rhodocyclaceae bacterium]|jgi:YidC/Oxa1 family membrane protein insertase|nr:membrane protein insertase YidC [Rhodocyclaceae bacterium]